jgi:O-antigen ligase
MPTRTDIRPHSVVPTSSSDRAPLSGRPAGEIVAYVLALAVPPLFAYSLTPSPTLFNQLWSVLGWGACLSLAWDTVFDRRLFNDTSALLAAFALMAISAVVSWQFGGLPLSLALPPLLMILAAGAVALNGARLGATAPSSAAAAAGASQPFEPFALGLVIAGTLSGVVSVVQVFWPGLSDGDIMSNLVARSGLVGRAVGNLRQPNHLSSVLLWGLIALVPLAEWRPRLRWLLAACGLLMMLSVLLSASRTGWLGFSLLFLWGVFDLALHQYDRSTGRPDSDARLRWSQRGALLAIPVIWAVMWFGLDQWAESTHHVFGAHARLAEHDVSSSRIGIWSNTLAMIRQQPWTGVGWGEFNFAWTLTPFPGRPTAFFDHTHNLPLQLLVELGIPLGGLVLLLLFAALVLAGVRAWRVTGPSGIGARAAFAVTLMILVHSSLEYPLWYAYFLLPAAWAWGFALGAGRGEAAPASASASASAASAAPVYTLDRWSAPIGCVMFALALVCAWDYLHITAIYAPSEDDTQSLEVREARGQRSPFYAHHADYADATSTEPPTNARGAFDRATHSLLDTRLMTAWSKELAAQGDLDRARYLAQRMLEFGKDQTEGFFDPCADANANPKPWQCLPPTKALTWRDFTK